MAEVADVWNETLRTARKTRWCLSGLEISPGEKYWDIRYLGDGTWSRLTLHPGFRELIDRWMAEETEPFAYEDWTEIEWDEAFVKELHRLLHENGCRHRGGLGLRIGHAFDRFKWERERAELKSENARLVASIEDGRRRLHGDYRVGELISVSRTFVKDWRDGDFALSSLALIHAQEIAAKVDAIEAAYREAGR